MDCYGFYGFSLPNPTQSPVCFPGGNAAASIAAISTLGAHREPLGGRCSGTTRAPKLADAD